MMGYRNIGSLMISLLAAVCMEGYSQALPAAARNTGVEYTLASGQPLKNGTPGGIGYFRLPSISAPVMGMARVNQDTYADLFLKGDVREPGLFLYYFLRLADGGTPVFSQPIKIHLPFPDDGKGTGVIMEDRKGRIWGFWKFGRKLKYGLLDKKTLQFSGMKEIAVAGIPRSFTHFGVKQLRDGRFLFLFSVQKEGVFGGPNRGAGVKTYTPEGMWPYDLPEAGLFGTASADPESADTLRALQLTSLQETVSTLEGYSFFEEGEMTYIISGTRQGNLLLYAIDPLQSKLSPRKYAVDERGILHRHPVIHAYSAYFEGPGGVEGLITTGEGGIHFYRNTGVMTAAGNLVLKDPVPVMQVHPELYGGSLVVPNVVDWDGDGKLDLVAGNSGGYLLFFKNTGSNEKPRFQNPVALKAGGRLIHIQPGYREDIQGPAESRWGYTCPTVVDWTGDGLPDILMGDSRGRFTVFVNRGTRTDPQLEPEHPLYLKGMDVHGTWRVKPGAGLLDGRMAYIILDRDDEFHLYWKLDDYNLADGGKLTIGDSIAIRGNYMNAGGVGRVKIELVDWDGDGIKDLLVGTPRKSTIPEPQNGLPYHYGKKNMGAALLFLRNSGTEQKPVFEYPVLLKFRGTPIFLGAHSCVPATTFLGSNNSLNLVVGVEEGTFIYYDRKDLTW